MPRSLEFPNQAITPRVLSVEREDPPMPKVVSEEQRLANGRNARQSTGPTTPEGKARSARNTLKHGLLARDVVLTDGDVPECREHFDALLADLIAELQPRTLIEETLVERIATGYWRLRRAQRFEVGAIRNVAETPDPDAQALQALRDKLEATRQQLSADRRFVELLDKPVHQLTEQERPELERLLKASGLREFDDRRTHKQVVRRRLPQTIAQLQANVHALSAELETAQRDAVLRRARRSLVTALPDKDALLKVVRYENMLDRQIHRALAELRRLRQMPLRDTPEKTYSQNEPI